MKTSNHNEIESDTSSEAKRLKLDLTDDQQMDLNDDLQLKENGKDESCDIIYPILNKEETEPANHLHLKDSPSKTGKVSLFHNVCYRIWRLKINDETNVLLKGVPNHKSGIQEIKMLVRCKTDGLVSVFS